MLQDSDQNLVHDGVHWEIVSMLGSFFCLQMKCMWGKVWQVFFNSQNKASACKTDPLFMSTNILEWCNP